jgi:hypothetical protein
MIISLAKRKEQSSYEYFLGSRTNCKRRAALNLQQ